MTAQQPHDETCREIISLGVPAPKGTMGETQRQSFALALIGPLSNNHMLDYLEKLRKQ